MRRRPTKRSWSSIAKDLTSSRNQTVSSTTCERPTLPDLSTEYSSSRTPPTLYIFSPPYHRQFKTKIPISSQAISTHRPKTQNLPADHDSLISQRAFSSVDSNNKAGFRGTMCLEVKETPCVILKEAKKKG